MEQTLEEQAEEQQEIRHHRIHHLLILAEPVEGECLEDKGELRNYNSPNQSKSRNPTSSTEMLGKILIPGGSWFRFIETINQRSSHKMNEPLIG